MKGSFVLPTLPSHALARPPAAPVSPRRAIRTGRAGPSQPEAWSARALHEHLPRARRHTSASLASLRRATSAHERRHGMSAPPVPRELLAAVPAWHSRATMERIIRVLTSQPHVAALCREQQIAVDTWAAIAFNDALDADTATGRGMRTSQAVAAARVGRSERVVRRARAISVRLGIMVELYRGRELSGDERKSLHAQSPGHRQRGLPNHYAMTVCPPRQRARVSTPRAGHHAQVLPHVEGFGHLPPEGGLSLPSHLLKILTLAAADASEKTEPPPAAQHRRPARPGIALAIATMTHPACAWLLGQVRPGRIAGQLAGYQRGGWSSHDLATELTHQARQAGIPTWEPPRSPLGLLKVLLRHIDPHADVHLGTGPAFPGQIAQLEAPTEPCGRSACDGHGWITTTSATGYRSARPCPNCPPAVRRNDVDVDQEPPF